MKHNQEQTNDSESRRPDDDEFDHVELPPLNRDAEVEDAQGDFEADADEDVEYLVDVDVLPMCQRIRTRVW